MKQQFKKKGWPYIKETPSQCIRRYSNRVMELSDRLDHRLNIYPFSLCGFCTKFWFEQGLEDSDWGCTAESPLIENGDVLHCKDFEPHLHWRNELETAWNAVLEKAIGIVLPYNKTKTQLEEDIAALQRKLVRAQKELDSWETRYLEEVTGLKIIERMLAYGSSEKT